MSAPDYRAIAQELIELINSEINKKERQKIKLPKEYSSDPAIKSKFEILQDEIYQLRETGTLLRLILEKNDTPKMRAKLRDEVHRAIPRHGFQGLFVIPGPPPARSSDNPGGGTTSTFSGSPPASTGPPRNANGTPSFVAMPGTRHYGHNPSTGEELLDDEYVDIGSPGSSPPPGGGTTTEENTCPVCYRELTPKTTHVGPCTHKVCKECYGRLQSPWDSGPKLGQKVCPTCRYNIPVAGPLVEPLRSQQGYGKYKSKKIIYNY